MPPAAPPTRKGTGDYHFHVFDYVGSRRFTLSPGQPAQAKQRFYSLLEDLRGLRDYGEFTGVPNISLSLPGGVLGAGEDNAASPRTLVLSFGNRAGKRDAPAMLITGGIHAREWIGAEMAYLIAEYLILNYSQKPSKDQATIRDLVDSRQIHIAPMLNPAGNNYTVFTPGQAARNWRKNRRQLPADKDGWLKLLTYTPPGAQAAVPNRPFKGFRYNDVLDTLSYTVPVYLSPGEIGPGEVEGDLAFGVHGVDPDRNFPTPAWGHETKWATKDDYLGQRLPAADVYFGPRALSEGEAANIAAHAAGLPSRLVAIDYHSYGRIILFPGETADSGRLDSGDRWLGEVLRLLTHGPYGADYGLGTPAELVSYSATGAIDTYLAGAKIARSYTIELDNTSSFSLPETEIRNVFETNIRGVLAALSAGREDEEAMTAALQQFTRWRVYGRGNRLPG